MRLRKSDISQKIKSNLKIEFASQDVSGFGGLELFRRYFAIIGLNTRIRSAFQAHRLSGDYSVVHFILVMITLWLTGGRRLSHIPFLNGDPLVKRLCGLKSLPSDRSVSRWLWQFTNDSLQAFVTLNSEIVIEKIKDLGLTRITLDFDGTVLSCGDTVKWAARGYNPQNRHAKSYFPLLCHIGQTGHFLRVMNRPGNVHDSKGGALKMIRECVEQIRSAMPDVIIEVRMDSAFFQEDIIKYFLREGIEFVVKVPMWKWLNLKGVIANRQRWHWANPRLAWFREEHVIDAWDLKLDLLFYREKLSDTPKKGHQFDLFTPDDGVYEYYVLLSNKNLKAENVLEFFNGRCSMEHQIAEIKGEFAFDVVPTRHYQGNSAHQQTSLLAYNLVRNFQIDTQNLNPRTKTTKRTNLWEFESLKTIRFELINAGARILSLATGKALRINHNIAREKSYSQIIDSLDNLAA